MTTNTAPPRLVLRCDECGLAWGYIERASNGRVCLITWPRHHGKTHRTVTPLDELAAMQPVPDYATMPDDGYVK